MTGSTTKRILTSLGAVLGGFAATFALSVGTDVVMHALGVFPPMGERMSSVLFALAAIYRALFTVVGGYVTARLAPTRPMAHAWALTGLGLLGGLGGLLAWQSGGGEAMGPLWYAASIPASAIPCIWGGARLGMRQRSRPSRPGSPSSTV